MSMIEESSNWFPSFATASAVDFQGVTGCSFGLLSSLSGGRGLFSGSLFLFVLFLGLVESPFLLSLDGEIKRSLH